MVIFVRAWKYRLAYEMVRFYNTYVSKPDPFEKQLLIMFQMKLFVVSFIFWIAVEALLNR